MWRWLGRGSCPEPEPEPEPEPGPEPGRGRDRRFVSSVAAAQQRLLLGAMWHARLGAGCPMVDEMLVLDVHAWACSVAHGGTMLQCCARTAARGCTVSRLHLLHTNWQLQCSTATQDARTHTTVSVTASVMSETV